MSSVPIRVVPAEDWPLIARSSARTFYRGGIGTTACLNTTGGGTSWADSTAGGYQSTVTSGTNSTAQAVASTTGATAGQVHYFGLAGVTRTVASASGTVVVYTSTVTTTTNETVAMCGDTYKPAVSMFYNDKRRRVLGLAVLRATPEGTAHTVTMNLSLWPNTIDGSGNWKPAAEMLDPSAWGTVAVVGHASGAVRMFAAMFANPVVLPVGWGWIVNVYKFDGGISGGFSGVALTRPNVIIASGPIAEGRYDGRLTPAIQYMATSPAAIMSGKTFNDAGSAVTTRPENLEYWFICE